jgi:cephalosporin hydroxylase
VAADPISGARSKTFEGEYREWLDRESDMREYMPVLREITERYSFPYVLEIGVRTGISTRCFLSAVAGRGGHVWSIDIDVPVVPPHWHRALTWSFIWSDSLAVEEIELPSRVDVLFIDGDHSYRHVYKELMRYVPLLRKGSTLVCHDTLLQVQGEPEYPVATALRDFGLTWHEHGGRYGLGEVRF